MLEGWKINSAPSGSEICILKIIRDEGVASGHPVCLYYRVRGYIGVGGGGLMKAHKGERCTSSVITVVANLQITPFSYRTCFYSFWMRWKVTVSYLHEGVGEEPNNATTWKPDPLQIIQYSLPVHDCFGLSIWITIGGFIKGILRGVRCTKSLRVLFLHPLLDHSCTVLKSSIHL